MTGAITIGLEEYEKLKAMEGKKVYTGEVEPEEIDKLHEHLEEYEVWQSTCGWGDRIINTRVHRTQVSQFREYEETIARREERIMQLRNRNLWERITRKYE